MNRTVIIDGMKLLKDAGFRLEGSEQVWHQLLASRKDEELRKAFRLVAQEYPYEKIRPASVIAYLKQRMLEENTFGAGNENQLALGGWQLWKDDHGQEFAHHPGMPGWCKPKPEMP